MTPKVIERSFERLRRVPVSRSLRRMTFAALAPVCAISLAAN
jgi:hypothetical protein